MNFSSEQTELSCPLQVVLYWKVLQVKAVEYSATMNTGQNFSDS